MEQILTAEHSLEQTLAAVNASGIATIGTVLASIISVINDPNSTPSQLKRAMDIDPPLVARVLRRANSAYYASPRTIGDLEEAVLWLGYGQLRELALSQKVAELFENDASISAYSRRGLWKHSLAVALLAKAIHGRLFEDPSPRIYTAGLLHDLGIIVEDQILHSDFIAAVKAAEADRGNLHDAEREIFGFDHAFLGMAIAQSWGLPLDVAQGIGFHHAPLSCEPEYAYGVAIVHLADYVCHECGMGYCDAPEKDSEGFRGTLDLLELDPSALKDVAENTMAELRQYEELGIL